MSKFVVTGGRRLEGSVRVSGSKNSALKLIPASLLADAPVMLTNVPQIRDVDVMLEIAAKLGAQIEKKGDEVTIDPSNLKSYILDPELSSRVRASVVFAAPLLIRFGKAVISLPGGDQIGERVLDTHFSMLKEFGVEMIQENGKFLLEWKDRKSPNLFLEEASVTATEMALIMGAGSKSEVKIEDAACEPHVSDLANFLAKMGAKINGVGTNTLNIIGKAKLVGVPHKVIPDHIDGSTFAIAAGITRGQVEIEDFVAEHYQMILHYLKNMGVEFEVGIDTLTVNPSKLSACKRKFQTRPYPGFPTDLMSPFIVLATQTDGTVLCHDWMYEWRVFFVDDLISMGANIFIADPHRVIVTGPTKLHGDRLFCKDIRAGVSILLAALCADGISEIENIEMIERGYEKIEERFASLGADIKRR